MSDPNTPHDLAERLRGEVMKERIIVAALAAGSLVFAGVAIYARQAGAVQGAQDVAQLLTWMAVVAAPMALVASRFVSATFVRNSRRQIADGKFQLPSPAAQGELGDADKFAVVHLTCTIIAAAVIEGAAFFNITVYLLGGSMVVLVLGVVLALSILLLFPSPTAVAEWIQQQQRLMHDEQQLAQSESKRT